jgi:hypothetical protein
VIYDRLLKPVAEDGTVLGPHDLSFSRINGAKNDERETLK